MVNGKRMSAFSPELPSAFRQLARQTGAYQTIETELSHALETADIPVQIKVIRSNQTVTLQWDPGAVYTLMGEIAIAGDSVQFRHGALNAAGESCVIERLGAQLIIDLTHHRLGRVQASNDSLDTEITARFRKRASNRTTKPEKNDRSTAIQRLQYNEDPLTFATIEEAAQCRFATDESTVHPVLSEPHYRLNIQTQGDDGDVLLQPCIGPIQDSLNLVDCRTPVSKVLDDFPLPIATQSWKKSVFTVISTVMESDERDPEVITDRILETQPNALPPQIDAVGDLVRRWLAARDVTDIHAFAGTHWLFYQPDWRLETICLTLPMRVSEDVAIDDRGYVVGAESMNRVAEVVSTHLATLPIQITYNQSAVQFQEWDVSATLEESGDQYILDPVILAGNVAKWRENWGDVLSTNGVLTTDTGTVMLTAETISAIRALLKYSPEGKKSKLSHSIVLGGRLRILDVLYLIKHGVRVNLPEKDAAIVQSLMAFDTLPRTPIPEFFTGILREYQHSGFDWLVFLHQHRFGACLADDMGLGKTIQAIAFLAWQHAQPDRKCNLIVVPPSLIYNWRYELGKFAPHLTVRDYMGAKREFVPDGCDVILTTYDIVRRDITLLSETEFDVIVFDEAQIIKNIVASRSAAVRRLNGRFRVCLTGTPLENHTGEFVSILEVAVPGLTEGIRRGGDLAATLIERARPFVLRRTKEKILKELPEKIETTVVLPLSDSQRAYYQRIVVEVREQVRQMFEKYRSGKAGMLAITALLRLRQLCITPRLIDPDYPEVSPKIAYLVDTLTQLQDEGHSALVFTQFRSFAELLAPALVSAGIRFIQIDGNTSVNDRKKLIDEFQQSPHSMVALMTLKTGGIGLNLVKASYVFHVDPWWNPAAENQASDRAHRIGQTQKVNVIRLIMQNSIEERVMTLKNQKQQLFDDVINNGMSRSDGTGLDRNDFQFLLG